MAKREKKSFWRVLFFSPFFSLVLILLLILVMISFFKTFIQERGIRKEIVALEDEIKKIEGEKIDLLETLDYLKSDFFKEKEAREKMEMQKPGEKAIIILPGQSEEEQEKKQPDEENLPIFKKWWQYLIK